MTNRFMTILVGSQIFNEFILSYLIKIKIKIILSTIKIKVKKIEAFSAHLKLIN
jgi:hypothetical protein